MAQDPSRLVSIQRELPALENALSQALPSSAEQRLRIIRTILVAGFVAAVWFFYVQAYYHGENQFPYNTFLYDPAAHFHDFTDTSEIVHTWDPYRNPIANHLPFSFLAMAPFFIFEGWVAYTLYFTFFLVGLAVVIFKALQKAVPQVTVIDLLALVAMSYPVLMVLDRGHPEGLLFLLLWGFVSTYRSRPKWSAFFLACATSMKGYPCAFLIIPLSEKRHKFVNECLGWCVRLTFVSLLVFKSTPLESIQLFLSNLSGSFNGHAVNNNLMEPGSLVHSVNLQGLFRILASPFWHGFYTGNPDQMVPFIRLYNPISLLLGIGLSIWAWREKLEWKRLFILSAAMILLPIISFGYRLLMLYLPLLSFIGAPGPARFDRLYSVLFGLLLVPSAYLVLHGSVSSVAIVAPTLLLIFLGALAFDRLRPGAKAELVIKRPH